MVENLRPDVELEDMMFESDKEELKRKIIKWGAILLHMVLMGIVICILTQSEMTLLAKLFAGMLVFIIEMLGAAFEYGMGKMSE